MSLYKWLPTLKLPGSFLTLDAVRDGLPVSEGLTAAGARMQHRVPRGGRRSASESHPDLQDSDDEAAQVQQCVSTNINP